MADDGTPTLDGVEREAKFIAPLDLDLPGVTVEPLHPHPDIVELVRHTIARSVAQILDHDPGVRLGDDPEDVHDLRVATRRLRSDLCTFASTLHAAPIDAIRADLGWLGREVGAARDTDVLGARLAATSQTLPAVDGPAASQLLGRLETQAQAARTSMLAALSSPRYLTLLDELVDLVADPPIRDDACSDNLARTVRRPWRRLAAAVDALGAEPTDDDLHRVRILAKRCRYAAEAVSPIVGSKAARFAAAMADVQTVLGDHQDTIVAERWLRDAADALPDARIAAGELIAIERSRRQELRVQWPHTWNGAAAKRLRRWL